MAKTGLSSAADPSAPATVPPAPAHVSFEEYKLLFESSERVTERRVAMNRFNYSVCAAIVLAIAVLANLSVERETLRLSTVLLIIALCLLGIVFCFYWVAQIDDAKQLNNAKFKVLKEMAPLVIFESSGVASLARSFSPFDREWQVLLEGQALVKVSSGAGKRLLVLKGGTAEYFVPKSFRVLFACFLLGTIFVTLANFGEVTKYPSPFSKVPSATPTSGASSSGVPSTRPTSVVSQTNGRSLPPPSGDESLRTSAKPTS